MKKRLKGVRVLTLAVLFVLCCRLYYIQILCGDALDNGARSQQMIQIQSSKDRGTVYDRNMIRLTDRCLSYYYLIEKSRNTVGLEKLMKKIDGKIAGYKGEDYTVYKAKTFDSKVTRQLRDQYGAYVFCSGSRYEDRQIGAHVIGYVSGSDKTGAAGLEKMFQYRLASSPSKLLMTGSGSGDPMNGLGIRAETDREAIQPFGLVTTLDAGLQEKTEEFMEQAHISGAVVIMKAGSGQILAMASSPSFNPNRVDNYLDSEKGELINKAVQGQYPPGSVFKIAVAAAALESGKVSEDETFPCTGAVEVNGVRLICEEHPEGHGKVNMKEAFAKSCNGYFAKIAEKTGSETIVDMAERLGLGKAVIDGFPDEETGAFPGEEDRAYSGLANLAVGQGSLLVTPVQICKMTNVIASGGIDYSASLVMSREHEEEQGKRVMTRTTAMELAEMMKAVCEEGTAKNARLNVPAAGKTGSAESGYNGKYTVHGWFTGYFPADDPAYTVTVIAENGKTGSSSALPVFEKIVNYLY